MDEPHRGRLGAQRNSEEHDGLADVRSRRDPPIRRPGTPVPEQFQPERRGRLEFFGHGNEFYSIPELGDIDRMEEVQVTVEEPWTDDAESTLRDWQTKALESAKAHNAAGKRISSQYELLRGILLFWSVVVFCVNGLTECRCYNEATIATWVTNAIQMFWTGLNSSLELGVEYRLHFELQAKCEAFALDIEYMLSRHRDYRVPADAFLTEMRERRKTISQGPDPFKRFRPFRQ